MNCPRLNPLSNAVHPSALLLAQLALDKKYKEGRCLQVPGRRVSMVVMVADDSAAVLLLCPFQAATPGKPR